MFHKSVCESEVGLGMLTAVKWYRATCAGASKGPWRETEDEARRDAIRLGLGEYDEWGQWFDSVPGCVSHAWVLEDQEVAA